MTVHVYIDGKEMKPLHLVQLWSGGFEAWLPPHMIPEGARHIVVVIDREDKEQFLQGEIHEFKMFDEALLPWQHSIVGMEPGSPLDGVEYDGQQPEEDSPGLQ